MLVLALLLAAGAAPPPTPRAAGRVAVLDVKLSPDVPPALGPWLAQLLAAEVGARTGAAPLVRADIVALLGFEREKRLLGCEGDDVSCIVEIGGALGASRVLVSSLSVAGSRYLLTLTLVEGRTATSLGRVAEMCVRDEEALLETVRRAAAQLLGGAEAPRARPPGPAAPAAVPSPADGGQGGRPGLFATRRGWALVAGVGALAFAGVGVGMGARALSSARSGDAAALSRAHLADALYAAAVAAGAAGVWLWLSAPAPDAPEPAARAALGLAPLPGGLLAGLEARW